MPSPSVDLLFYAPPAADGRLLFGDDGVQSTDPQYDITVQATLPGLTLAARIIPNAPLTVDAALPALSLSAKAIPDAKITLLATLPGLALTVDAAYRLNPPSRTIASAASAHQVATAHASLAVTERQQIPSRLPVAAVSAWQPARRLSPAVRSLHQDASPTRHTAGTAHQGALRCPSTRTTAPHQMASPTHTRTASGYQPALMPGRYPILARHQDGFRDRRRWVASAHQDASPLATQRRSQAGASLPLPLWRAARHQDAIQPTIGQWLPEPPIKPPCYSRSGVLLFQDSRAVDGNLLFICDLARIIPPVPPAAIIIPTRRVYMQLNQTSLVLAESGQDIPARSLSLSIDVDSWAWGWSAVVPAQYLAVLSADPGAAVEVLATINGTEFRLAIERIQRNRSFGTASLAISGRGRAAWLASPYAAVTSRDNQGQDQTAQQLMAAALTENGASLGWALDWQITDWLVPAGSWLHSGTPIEACLSITEAAGAYLQADRLAQTLHVLPRYPSAPWEWPAQSPAIELPEAVCITEGIEYVDKPAYNTVFVAGQQNGILAHVTRAGTAGNTPAPMVTHPLITHADAGRQRGLSILADVGRQKHITLSLPVLTETGIITPGQLVRYTEQGQAHIGLTRAVDVSVEFPKVRQTIRIESHVLQPV